uniref:Uncharacterized protein n=1 Tax=Monopterus albus TaxID=43700 RepID=A0A3Q3ID00_MONAL
QYVKVKLQAGLTCIYLEFALSLASVHSHQVARPPSSQNCHLWWNDCLGSWLCCPGVLAVSATMLEKQIHTCAVLNICVIHHLFCFFGTTVRHLTQLWTPELEAGRHLLLWISWLQAV